MRLRHPSGRIVHFGCEVIPRPARNLPAVIARLDTCAAARSRLGADSLGVSLWLSPALAAVLAVDVRSRTRLRGELDARGLEVVAMSGTPFAEGGDNPEDEPGWDTSARREYTLDLARILLDLLPEDAVRGVVSTAGLTRRDGWDEAVEKSTTGTVRRLSAGLADLAWQNGRAVRVGFQPGAGWVLDSPEETVAALSRIDKDRLGVCLDLGHVARAWTDPAAGIETVTDAGLSLIEVRRSAADSSPAALAALFGPDGPLTEYLTLTWPAPDPTAEQITADVAYVLRELAALGLAPENEPCVA